MMHIFSSTAILVVFQFISITMGFGMEPPRQGTFIVCEECVLLYPEKYKVDSKSCPVCSGKKEYFQPARMMTGELVDIQAYELERKIERFLLQTILSEHKNPISILTLKKIRGLYRKKLIFHLLYNKFEREPIKATILELDELIEIIFKKALDLEKGVS